MLRTAEGWVGTQSTTTNADGPRLILDPGMLADKEREVHYFGDHVAS